MKKEAQLIGKLLIISGLISFYGCGGGGGGGENAPGTPLGSVRTMFVTYDGTGTATGYVNFTNGASHNPIKAVSMDVGPDNLPFTSDDTVKEYSLFRYDDQNRQLLYHYELQTGGASVPVDAIRYTGRGADNAWFTADDVAYGDHYGTRHYNADGSIARQTLYNSPGNDMVWLTADDSISYYIVNDTPADNGTHPYRYYGHSGPDQTWFTDDDVMAFYSDGEISYNDAGNDRVWFTADDIVEAYYSITTDFTTGVNYLTYTHTGDDLVMYTSDDYAMSVQVYLRSPGLDFRASYSPGGDLILGTSDDEWHNIPTKSEFDNEGHLIKQTKYSSAGADNLFLTDDDVVSWYAVINYDANENQLERIEYAGAGLNGTWFDEDDEVSAYEVSEFASGYLKSIKRYINGGANQTWFDDDDVISAETRYSLYY